MDERELTALGQLLAERICGTNEAFCFQILRLLGPIYYPYLFDPTRMA